MMFLFFYLLCTFIYFVVSVRSGLSSFLSTAPLNLVEKALFK